MHKESPDPHHTRITRRETGGYGLGLYLCRRIDEVHGGTLDVTSEPPHGTQIRVTLPL